MSASTSPQPKRELSDACVRSLDRPGKYADGEIPGPYLEISKSRKDGKTASKAWRLKYRLNGKENRYSIGMYPLIGFKEARELAWAARRDLANSVAPLQAKLAKIDAQRREDVRTFRYVAEQWLAYKTPELVAKSLAGFEEALANHVYPASGRLPVTEIKLEHISAVITKLKGSVTMAMAKRVRTVIRSVLGFAEGRGWVERNVALSRSDELRIKHVVASNPAIEKPEELGRFLNRLDDFDGGPSAWYLGFLLCFLSDRESSS